MNTLTIGTYFYILICLGFMLSLSVNLLFVYKSLARKYPSVFYEEDDDE